MTADEAGMHLIAGPGTVLNNVMDDIKLSHAASGAGVTAAALSSSFMGKALRPGLMLGYAAHDEDAIVTAGQRLAEAMSG